jgi:hypothetical protein
MHMSRIMSVPSHLKTSVVRPAPVGKAEAGRASNGVQSSAGDLFRLIRARRCRIVGLRGRNSREFAEAEQQQGREDRNRPCMDTGRE